MESIPANRYFQKGIVKLTPDGPHPVENTSLFHCTYLIGNNKFELEDLLDVRSFIDKDGNVSKDLDNGRSHDNMTAVFIYLMLYFKWHKSPRRWAAKHELDNLNVYQYLHPRDLLWFFKQKNPILAAIINVVMTVGLFFLLQKSYWYLFAGILIPEVMLFIIYFYMAIRKYKYRNGNKILKTDTEILYGLRLELSPIWRSISLLTIEPLLQRKYSEQWFRFARQFYYKYEEHPNHPCILANSFVANN